MTLPLELIRKYECEGRNVELFYIRRVDLYVLKAGRKAFFAVLYKGVGSSSSVPEKLPTDKHKEAISKGWSVFMSEALSSKLNLESLTFEG